MTYFCKLMRELWHSWNLGMSGIDKYDLPWLWRFYWLILCKYYLVESAFVSCLQKFISTVNKVCRTDRFCKVLSFELISTEVIQIEWNCPISSGTNPYHQHRVVLCLKVWKELASYLDIGCMLYCTELVIYHTVLGFCRPWLLTNFCSTFQDMLTRIYMRVV